MLTLITGTPGAGKSLYAVWKLARHVPETTIEQNGESIKRRLFSNIKNLLVEHTHIEAADLDCWHTWAKPGDVILFDEVQEVWRPRGLGTKVPDCIAKLETHRHMGVDIILVTQHPMLVDPNIRRLVNQHMHMRRLAGKVSMVYEWDHCSNPQQTTTCVHSGLFWFPKEAFSLYKSAQLHTKPTSRLPKIAYVGLAASAALVYAGPTAYSRLTGAFQPQGLASKSTPKAGAQDPKHWDLEVTADGQLRPKVMGAPPAKPGQPGPVSGTEQVAAAPLRTVGCITMAGRCECFGSDGHRTDATPDVCEGAVREVATVVALDMTPTQSRPYVPTVPDQAGPGGPQVTVWKSTWDTDRVSRSYSGATVPGRGK